MHRFLTRGHFFRFSHYQGTVLLLYIQIIVHCNYGLIVVITLMKDGYEYSSL